MSESNPNPTPRVRRPRAAATEGSTPETAAEKATPAPRAPRAPRAATSTPVAPTTYLWAYGDGSAATKYTTGGTWAAQGIAEFEPTPTSHVYEQVGDYTITLSIVFRAEYRFAGGPWRPVVGTITLPANDLYIRVGTAKTVLVEHDCLENPAGPGC